MTSEGISSSTRDASEEDVESSDEDEYELDLADKDVLQALDNGLAAAVPPRVS